MYIIWSIMSRTQWARIVESMGINRHIQCWRVCFGEKTPAQMCVVKRSVKKKVKTVFASYLMFISHKYDNKCCRWQRFSASMLFLFYFIFSLRLHCRVVIMSGCNRQHLRLAKAISGTPPVPMTPNDFNAGHRRHQSLNY